VAQFTRIFQSRIKKYGIKKFVFFGSKTGVPIPQYFKDFCEEHGVDIDNIQEEESMENVINKLNNDYNRIH
jgi:hypothetical protein